MRKAKYLVLALVMSLFCDPSYAAETLDIAVTEFCPYLCDPARDDGKEGYVAEILKSVYEPAGYKLEFHRVPYERGILGTEQGIFDGMPMLNRRSSEKIVLSEDLCGVLVQNFYVKKGNPWRYDGMKSLEGINVGSVEGYNYAPLSPDYEAYLRKYGKTDPKRVFYAATEDPSLTNLQWILEGKVTTFNECASVIDYLTSKEGLEGKFDVAGTLGVLENYMGISPQRRDSRKLAELFDRGMKELRETGRLDAILGGYGLQDWKK